MRTDGHNPPFERSSPAPRLVVRDRRGSQREWLSAAADNDASYGRAAWIAVCRSQAVAEFDMAGTITWANDKFLDLVGYRAEQIFGQHHRQLCFPDQIMAPSYQAFWTRLASGEYASGEYVRRRADGGRVWLQATYNPVFDEYGMPSRVLKIATDITQQVESERQAKDQLLELEGLQTELKERAFDLERSVVDLAIIARSIATLADQTSLLALNASIEAAHVGEAGRVSATIAAEMTRLAADTRAATDRAAYIVALHTPRAAFEVHRPWTVSSPESG